MSRGRTRNDLLGQRFGRLVVIDYGPNDGKYTTVVCQCDCGLVIEVQSQNVVSGKTKSCGCLRRETSSDTLKKIQKNRRTENDGIS